MKPAPMPPRDVEFVGSTDGSAIAKMDQARAERRAEVAAVPVKARGDRPPCRACGVELRLYKWRADHPGKLYGDYGDGLFCGLRCGYAFGLAVLRGKA